MVVRLPKRCHISPVLVQLHWLPVSFRIKYKILLIVHKALHDKAPVYIKDMLRLKNNPNRSLRSNDKCLLVIPKTVLVTYGDRSFRSAAPYLWNQLPLDVRCIDNIDSFKCSLKTHLFKLAFEL